MDKRIKNTKEKIRNCFVALLEKKKLDDITVTEICDMAGVNRATFYKYYDNQYDLLKKLERDYIREIMDAIKKSKAEGFPRLIRPIIEKVRSTRNFFSVIISENGDSRFRETVFSLCYSENMNTINARFTKTTETQKKWLYFYMAEGLNGIFHVWMEDGMKESSDEIVRFAQALVNSINDGFESHL